jgi:hypothetical protein
MTHRRFLVILSSLVCASALAAPTGKTTKKKEPVVKVAPVPVANEKAVSELLGPWQWGMTVDDVLTALQKQLLESKAPELAKMSDVYAQTQLRKQIKGDVENVRKSFTKFEGQKSGWDVSIVEGEFMHNDDEAMLLYREADPATGRQQQRFFFFRGGKLWKQFIAFNMEPYKGKTFADFREAMESRYGKGAPIVKRGLDKQDHTVAVAWRASGTYLRAVDLTQFYANFCVAFSDDSIEKQVASIRSERTPKTPMVRGMVNDSKGGGDKVLDPNADVIDRIIGDQPTGAAAGDSPTPKP